ncbi:sugar ABC transporter substrate-binding protein [Vagococcus salmoninarum]|uniref:Sugar ABC transporter substrate-binding protein n=1 Tax=Vagococcus salmoninarum TaxID=2739 RepID=A0A429ZQN2_9ENTE|nr:sugar ABC transporter substrate-binding protein [Vagococcus salmoninarum]RST96034.1 sugar ABC transporter substrate-binding protein [Vagococcus salmoninarum]
MKMSKKVLGVSTVLLASMVLIAGCSSKEKKTEGGNEISLEGRYELDATKPAWTLDKKEEMTELTWYVNADWWNTDFGNDVVTKKIKEDLNVDIKFLTGDDTKLNTFFAGGDMPDIVTVFDAKSKVAQQANTWALPLDDLAKKYDPYFLEVAAEDTMKWFQLEDGKTYGYPNYSNTAADYESGMIPANTNFLIRQDVYKGIGEPAMGTPAEFQAAMKLIHEKFPELTPFGFNSIGEGVGSLGDALQDFIGVPLETEDGDFYNRNLDEDYLAWLETLNKVYRDGNISDDSFADDGVAFEEKIKSGKYATIMANGTAQMSSFLQAWLTADKDAQYIAIDGPQSTKGNEPTLPQSGISGWMNTFVSKTNEEPAKTMQIFTYLQSLEGGILTTFGIEGETFQKDKDGKFELLPEILTMKENDPDNFKKDIRLSEFFFFGHDRYQAMASDKVATPALVQPRAWGEGKLVPHFILENIEPKQGSAEARALSGIDTNWSTTLVSMIRANSDKEFKEALDNHKKFLTDNGMDEITKIRSENMEKNREKLGITK